MKLGVFSFNTAYGIRPDVLGRALEERGFESLWLGEHTHIPASRRSPYPGGDPLPHPYYHMADPFISLMAAAAATRTLKIGTAVCLVVERDPITLAKEVATLDLLSGGRFLFGVGGGWNAEEMENHGTPFTRRWTVLRERIEAMKEIWTREKAEYHGQFVDFDPIVSFPKPLQEPHPPIILGTATARGRQRVVDYCDGWMPIDVLLDDLPTAMADLAGRARAAGRDPAKIPVSVFSFAAYGEEDMLRCRDLGVARLVTMAPRRGAEAMAFLDRLAALIPRLG